MTATGQILMSLDNVLEKVIARARLVEPDRDRVKQ